MDKYTVDLDKVLNDFEYSEYSLETSKGNRSVQDENPNSSNHCSRNDTAVKHSINNVFHSLNEYLSSDITPKKIENECKNFKSINISDQPLEEPNYSLINSKENHETQHQDNFNSSVVDKTDICAIINRKSNEEECIKGNDKVDESITEIFDNKCLEDEHPQNLAEADLNKETPEEILIDLSIKDSSNSDINILLDVESDSGKITTSFSENNDHSVKNEENLPSDNKECFDKQQCSLIDNDEVCANKNEECSITDNQLCTDKNEDCTEDKDNENLIDNIPNQKNIEDEEIKVDNEENKITTVGFSDDVEFNEQDIEQYFNELEEELEFENKVEEKTSSEEVVIPSNVEETPVESEEIVVNTKEIETPKGEESERETGNLCEDPHEFQATDTRSSIEEIEVKISEKVEETATSGGNTEETTVEATKSEETENTEETPSEGTEDDAEESEKSSRPQVLSLNDEVRKIDLVGEPGSTPYNNLYSTEDFAKNATGGGDQETARAVSPTYSDVSTDSVSSDPAEEPVQNNMVHTVEVSKNDVTMDKDFKDNLRTRVEDGPGPSCERLEESKDEPADLTDVEGACALETNSSEGAKDVEEPKTVGEASSVAGIDWLGKQAPLWIPDSEAMSCMHCDMKFTVIKRRHHCRACGLVLCSKCCNLKFRLEYLNAEARVCTKCFEILDRDTNSNSGSEISQESSSPSRNLPQDNQGQPNPNNPLEYCSTVPPSQQMEAGSSAVPSVMVPVGVLKRKGSNKGRSNKSVMFCDGIRPGSDLTNLDTDFNYSENQKSEKAKKSGKTGRGPVSLDAETKSFIPRDESGLPPTVTIFKTDIKYSPCTNNSSVVEMLKNEPLIFALQSNVFVHVKIINMECCVSRTAWCFSTEGLINVGQDEIVILLEFVENESLVPKDVFVHLNYVYLEAVRGNSIKELGISLHPTSPFLGSKNHFGFIYIRPTFQCLQNVVVPKEPYLIGILIHRWETPWAKLFPLRLILRLGAEYKYYPSPVISTRDRDSVFVEIGHTIINLLADFRNFSYTLPQIRGLTIHMEDKNTTVTIPKNRYDQVLKSLSNSSDHILAFAGNFSVAADSHLVCIQDTQSASNNYSTHAINICNQPRKVTGASFIVFNGALKSTSGLTAKSNIVEDGLMIQILPEHMLQVRDSLKNMKNHTIKCGCVNEESYETVTIVWGEPDTSFNVGVLSPIDNKDLTGVPSIRVHNGKDYTCNSGNRLIRWTEVFIDQNGEDSAKNQESLDISKISENISKATCQALVKYLDLLVSNSFFKIGLRAHVHIENVSYSAGSNNVKLPPIYMKSLDNELIPVLHRIASNNVTEQPVVLELIFRILNI